MAKKKKTRKQKIIADKRHEAYVLPVQTPSLSVGTIAPVITVKPAQRAQISILEYSYLYSDLRKTILVTIAIVIIELITRYYIFGA